MLRAAAAAPAPAARAAAAPAVSAAFPPATSAPGAVASGEYRLVSDPAMRRRLESLGLDPNDAGMSQMIPPPPRRAAGSVAPPPAPPAPPPAPAAPHGGGRAGSLDVTTVADPRLYRAAIARSEGRPVVAPNAVVRRGR
jgi:hypothetical protein